MKKKLVNTLCLGLVGVTAVAALASCGDKKTDGDATYTYNGSYSGEFSVGGWDPLTWQLSLDSVPLGYTTVGLYSFNVNSTKDGYVIDPELASAAPVDVSSQYGHDAGSGYAYKISLKEGAKFDNGKEITAQTFIDSYKLLIDPAYDNYRATTYETDGIVIKNSEKYHYQGTTRKTTLSSAASLDGIEDYNDVDADTNVENAYYVSLSGTLNGVKKDDFVAAYPQYADKIVDDEYVVLGTTYAEFKPKFDELFQKYMKATQEECDAYVGAYSYVNYSYEAHDESWFDENIGLKATGTYELTFVLDTPIDVFNFQYNSSSTWLVEPEAYKAMTTTASDGTKSSTYNKTAATSVSYGPYKIDTYTTTEFTLKKNESWYGYSDAYKSNYEGMYQTTNLKYSKIENDATCLMAFNNGDLDEVSLSADNISQYANSDRKYITPETYLMSLFMNSDKEKLQALDAAGTTKNAVLVSYDDFRQGLSFCLDRVDAAQAAPGSTASAMLLNDLYMADAQKGVSYRTTDSAKSVYSQIYGEGANDVNASYSIDKAVEYFNKAYDAAVADGVYKAGSEIVLNIGMSNTTSTEYTSLVSNVQKYLSTALAKSKFGSVKVTINAEGTAGSRYGNLLAGKTVMAFCAWGGNPLSPYGFLQVYFTDDYNYMPGFHPSKEYVTIDVAGESVKMTYTDWWAAISTGKYSDAYNFPKLEADSDKEHYSQVYLLSQLETAYLKQLEIIPMYALGSASLLSYKVNYYSEEYISVVGRGGVQYLTYNYTDAEWEKVKSTVTY